MRTYYGNYLGMVVTGGEKDPEGRGRCQIFIPHIMPALYEGWNREGEDISFDIVGEGLPTALKPEIVETLKKILPWAECAAPMVGASPSTKNGSEIERNTARVMRQVPGLAPVENLDLNNINFSDGGSGSWSYSFKDRSTIGQKSVISNRLISLDFNSGSSTINNPLIVIPDDSTPQEIAAATSYVDSVAAWLRSNGVNATKGIVRTTSQNGRGVPGQFHTEPFFIQNTQAYNVFASKPNEYAAILANTLGTIDGATFITPHRPGATGAVFNGISEEGFAINTILPELQRIAGNTDIKDIDVNHSAINLDVGKNLREDGESGGTDYDLEQGSLPENIKSKITPESEAALNRVAARYGLDPNAIAMMVNTESEWNPNKPSPKGGTYRGATQIGELTFREAGGTLGGLTWSQFLNAPIHRQIDAYGDWLKHYKFSTKIDTAGINLNNLTTAQQAAFLQAFQFSPNHPDDITGSKPAPWMTGFASGNGSIPATYKQQATRLGSTSMDDMSKYYTELYGGSIAQIASTQKIIQNPTEHAASYGPNTNYQAVGMFGYASEGTAVWTFFREGNPLFPVYFAASYGQKEWQNMYQHSSQGIGCGDGGALPGTEKMRFNSYGGGFDSTQVMENPELGLEPGYAFQVFGKNGSNLLFTADHTEFNSVYNHNQRVSGDFHEITEANKEQRVRGDSNSYLEQDVYVTVGNWSDEAIAASDEIQEYLNEAMRIKSGKGSAQQQTTYNPTQSLANVQQAASKAANAVIDTAQRFTSKRT